MFVKTILSLIMEQIFDFCNIPTLESGSLPSAENTGKSDTSLEMLSQDVLDQLSKENKENTINHWMEIASPILKSGGKPVAIILSLGFISIPLMISGSPWVALTLAIGASLTAVCSCLS